MRERQEIRLPKLEAVAKPLRRSDAVETEYDINLFEKLRLLRKELADEQGIPPFVVFGDLALRQMASYLPQSQENFARISGVGEAKLKQYGKMFTGVIQAYAEDNNLSEKPVPVKDRPGRPGRGRLGSTYRETRDLVLQKCPLRTWRRREV